MELSNVLTELVENDASDIFIVSGARLSYKANGEIMHYGEQPLSVMDTEKMVREILSLAYMELEKDISDFYAYITGIKSNGSGLDNKLKIKVFKADGK
ncbi:MAG: hypothetical protein IJD85_02345, partial [Oscillospiraceae bacterium]|nr:hypothetical protein [Oscillospiraceae bacterium]